MNRSAFVCLLAVILFLVWSCGRAEANKDKELADLLEKSVGGTVTVKGLAMQSVASADGLLSLFGFHAENQWQGNTVFWVIARPRKIESGRNYSITGELVKKSGDIEGFSTTFSEEVYIITPGTIQFLSHYKGPESTAGSLLAP